jgi:hypothetical protein
MMLLLRWFIDSLLYLAAVSLSMWLAGWPDLAINLRKSSPLLDFFGLVAFWWVATVPIIIGRPIALNSVRNPATGSISRVNYLAISFVWTVFFGTAAINATMTGRILCAVSALAPHVLLSFVTPVRIHGGGRLGEPE